MSSGSKKQAAQLNRQALRRFVNAFRMLFLLFQPPSSSVPVLRSRSDPLEIPAAYGDLPLELRFRIPLHGPVSLFTDLNLVGISAAMCLAVLALRVLGVWLANDFAFSIFMLLALVLACHAFLPSQWTEPSGASAKILSFAVALFLVKALAGNGALAALIALIAIVVTCVLADQMVTNWVYWHLADPRLQRPAVAAWRETWARRIEAPKELPDYWIAFAGIAAASLLAMVLSVAIVPPAYLGMGFVTLVLFFVFVLLVVSLIWQPLGVTHAIRSSWEPLVNWFYYNPGGSAAPGVYQSPFRHRYRRVWIVLALLVVSLLPLAAFFPIHKALIPGTPWLSAAARWNARLQAAPESWILSAARGAMSGDSRFVWAVVMGVLASVLAPVALLISTAMLIASRAVPTIKSSPRLEPRNKGADFDYHVEQILNSSYRHADGTWERDHLFLGIDTIQGRPILLARSLLDGHAHILGSTQSGKTSLALTPMISQMIRSLQPESKNYRSQSSILILDLKGDMPMFQNTKIECERRGVKFKYFTLGFREASYVFNPFEQTHLAEVSLDQRADMLAQAMGIFYGHKYPEVFWSDINAQVLRALLITYPEIRSFARFHHYMKDPSWYQSTGGKADEWKKASHVKAAADKLARIVPLNVTAKETPSAEAYRDRIDMRNLGSRSHDPEVIYFYIRATDDESAGHAVAKLALYSLLTAVNTIPERDKKRTYVVIDEFQCIALDTLSRLFEQAAGLQVSYILGNQSLATLPEIIQEVLAENTAFRQIFRAGSVKARKNIRERSGDSIYNLYSHTYSEHDSITLSQQIGPGYFESEIIRTSYEDSVSWVEMSAGRGFSRYGGHIFTIHTPHHISKSEYERRKRLGFPPVGASTLVAADAQRILEVYQPRMITREGLAETIEQQLVPKKPPQEPALTVNAIAGRLSLRQPQRDSLEILAHVCELIDLEKGADPAKAIETIKAEFPTVTEFEREFPSLCFALATGVGKTRFMGAFISYLYQAEGIRHFFVLAPNLTIYNKLITDFTPNTPKYVFQGIADFATTPPEIITGDNYESGRGVRTTKKQHRFEYGDESVHVNIFNISKINSEVRGGKAPRIKRLGEYIGESYFEYLSKLDDLVLLMDESHRYRASAGVRAINELKPILGLELTATPQVERGAKAEPFKNVIYSYPLSAALNDGFVKEPAVATRENFDPKNYDKDGLEKLKLEDGVRIHEETKVQLEVYARENGRNIVKPFILVVAENTEHANAIVRTMESDDFFEGRYKGRVITVHSAQTGDEKDETVAQLLTVEDPNNPTEVVVHVNMLKEGWDVTNLYTIVPLRAANSKTLVEQSIGRGLRLPYGKRTGVPAVDRLTIVSHDRFQEIIDEANKPDSIIRTGVVIGRDIPDRRSQVIEVKPEIVNRISGATAAIGGVQQRLFDTAKEQEVAHAALQVIRDFERLPRSADLRKPEVQKQIVDRVTTAVRPVQGELEGVGDKVDIAKVVAKTIDLHIELSIDIPRIVVAPTGEVTCGFKDFDLDVRNIRLQPVAKDILIQHLRDHSQHRLVSGEGVVEEDRLENYLIRGLIDFDDINYDEHADLLYKLTGQVVRHLQSYLTNDEDVVNVLQYHQQALVKLVHAQMQDHYEETVVAYEAHVSKGFTTLSANTYSVPAGEEPRNFRTPVEERLLIRGMIFGGFSKCLYPSQKFDTDSERRFAVILENDQDVLKWFKPAKGTFRIHYSREAETYEPDFVVEAKAAKYLCEPKRANEMTDPVVLSKAQAAAVWCKHATEHELAHDGKPWSYLLIPHDAIAENKTINGLSTTFQVVPTAAP